MSCNKTSINRQDDIKGKSLWNLLSFFTQATFCPQENLSYVR